MFWSGYRLLSGMTCQRGVQKNKNLSLKILSLSIYSTKTRIVVVIKCAHWMNTVGLKVPVGELPNV